jgi:biopolymer transport protein ExbD
LCAAAIKIPYGQTYATTTFTSTYLTRSAIVTAQASGYTTGQATISTYIVDQASLNVTVTADPDSALSGSQTSLTAYVTYPGGIPAPGAIVQFASSSGGSFGAVADQGNGYYKATFTVPTFNVRTNVTVTATVSKTDYMTSHADTQVIVVSTVNVGNMQVCIKDGNGQPLADAIVSTLSQPAGMNALMDISNSTGYVTFPNVMEGLYTVGVSKLGYTPINQTIDFRANSSALTLFLTASAENQPGPDLTLILLVLIAIIVVVIVVAAAYIQRRKTAKRFQVPKKWEPPAPPKPRSETSVGWTKIAKS